MPYTIFLAYYWAEGVEFWFWLVVFIFTCLYSFLDGLTTGPCKQESKTEIVLIDKRPRGLSGTVEIEETKTPLTNQEIIDDALSGLVSLGYKKREVSKIVSDLVKVKQYEKAEDLIRDVFKHAKK